MCSTCDCDQAGLSSELNNDIEKKRQCRKCSAEEPFIVLEKVHVECKRCFLESCNKKIRSTIGKSKLLRNNDPILIAHSGGASSSALLDLIKCSMEYDARREQKFRPSVLHVDTRFDTPAQDRVEKLQAILCGIRELCPDWPIYWTTIERASSQPDCDFELLYFEYNHSENFADNERKLVVPSPEDQQSFLKSIENLDLTDRQQRIHDCVMDLIVKVAKQMNISGSATDCFKYVFTGSSATQLANSLLVDVILGNGSNIKSTVGICDKRSEVPILRPMRDFSKKEIIFYLRARAIISHPQTNVATLFDKKASIQKLTESFLSKLYIDYPSTYSTLLRTGNKMQE